MSMSARWILAVLLLSPAIVVPLLVPIYDSPDPELFGFPFFYWFQLALILAAVVLTAVAYFITKDHRPNRTSGTEGRDR